MALITLKILVALLLIAVAAFLIALLSQQSAPTPQPSVTSQAIETSILEEFSAEEEEIFNKIERELG